MLFTMYIKPLSAIIDSHSIIHHSFADDLQLQMSSLPDRILELLHSMQSCISDVKAWATANMLTLNDSKTEHMLVTSKRSKHLHNNFPCSIFHVPCELDPIPSKLLIECIDFILPSLTDLFNSSLASGIFPQCFKSALVTHILKKRCLDHNDLNNYRPVSNLCFIAKILEKLVLSQVSSYLTLTIFTILVNQHIVQVTALKQLF